MSQPQENPSIELAKKIVEGEIPSNREIEEVIDSTKRAIESQPLQGQYGARLTSDLKETLTDVKEFIEMKNPNEEIQHLVKDAKEIAKEGAAQAPVVTQHGQELLSETQKRLEQMRITGEGPLYHSLECLRNAAKALLYSPELRRFLFEFIALMQDIVSTVVAKTQPEITATLESGKPPLEKASEVAEKATSLSKEIIQGPLSIPIERREELHRRWKALLSSVVRNPEVIQALNELLSLLDQLKPQIQALTEEAKEKAQQIEVPEAVQRAREDIISMIANFTGRENLERFLQHIRTIFNRISTDRESSLFFNDFRSYLREAIENPRLIEDENYLNRFQSLYERSYDLIQRWNVELRFDNLLWEGRYLLLKIANDPTTQRIIEDLKALGKDLFLDSRGRPSLQVTTESVSQIRSLLLPVLLENLKSIPVPIIVGSTPKYDYRLENVVLQGYDILPENVKVHMESNFDVNITGTGKTALPTSVLTFKFRKIKVSMKNVKFDFYRKVLPRIHDKGVADFDIYGDRTRIVVKFQVTFTDIGPIFTLLKAKSHIKKFDINIKESQHKWLLNTITTLFHGTVKESIEDAINSRLRQMLLATEKNLNSIVRTSATTLTGQIKEQQPVVLPAVHPLGTI